MTLPPYVVLDKAVGETPLACMEAWRASQGIAADIPLTYAGRLDPMASGKLLVLIGEECKKKEQYLTLDKTYEFAVLLGIGSDTHDVLGRLTTDSQPNLTHSLLRHPSQTHPAIVATSLSSTGSQSDSATSDVDLAVTEEGKTCLSGPERPDQGLQDLKEQLQNITQNLTGDIEHPYPHFSSKTVQGKPLHMWTLEGRLDEIEIPTRKSTIYSLTLDKIETKNRADICAEARAKIDTIPEVTNPTKSLGNDFRRADVRADWERIKTDASLPDQYHIAHFTCHASSGTYMRTLAKMIGEKLTQPLPSLAWSIHRTKIEIVEIN